MASFSIPPPLMALPRGPLIFTPRLSSSTKVRSIAIGPLICTPPPPRRLSSTKVRATASEDIDVWYDFEDWESPPPRMSGPWLMLPPAYEFGDAVYNFYDVAKEKVAGFSVGGIDKVRLMGMDGDTEVVGSSHGFLALFHKRNHDLLLYNPISHQRINLPSIHTLSLSDIGMGPVQMRVTKVIVTDDRSRAMMIYGPGNRLAFCCPGRSNHWTPLFTKQEEDYSRRAYSDVVYSKRDKLFTCLTYTYTDHFRHHNGDGVDQDMEEWDLRLSRAGKQVNSVHQLKFEKYDKPPWWYDFKDVIGNLLYCHKEAYVLFPEHSNQLYVVYRYIMRRDHYKKCIKRYGSRGSRFPVPVRGWADSYPYKTIGFSVFKAARVGLRTLQLNYMEEGSLDNLVMFLGRNHSFALPAETYPEFQPDSIYFTDNPCHTPVDWQTYGAHDTGIYSFNDRTFYPLDYPNDVSRIKGLVSPLLWFIPSQCN